MGGRVFFFLFFLLLFPLLLFPSAIPQHEISKDKNGTNTYYDGKKLHSEYDRSAAAVVMQPEPGPPPRGELPLSEQCMSSVGVKILISYNVIGLHFPGCNEATYCNKCTVSPFDMPTSSGPLPPVHF